MTKTLPSKEAQAVRNISLSAGDEPPSGFVAWSWKLGYDPTKLAPIADGQLDAIHASHVLQRYGHAHTVGILREWARALRVGGRLLVSVPDFDAIIKRYVGASNGSDVETALMGAQGDDDSCNLAIFNRDKLTAALAAAGFDVADDWKDPAAPDWSSLSVVAVKRGRRRYAVRKMPDAVCLMSMPRLAWTENMTCMVESCSRLGMAFVRATGVFWGQSLERMMASIVAEGRHEWIITCDYDSVFTPQDVVAIRSIAEEHGLDALAPLQVARDRDTILAALDDGNGQPVRELDRTKLSEPYWPCLTAHFGLTAIRVDALRRLPHPWFLGSPDPKTKSWDNGRIDDDIHFWNIARANGWRCAITPQVVIGHMQALVSWPTEDLTPVHQYVRDYQKKGRPQWSSESEQPRASS